MYRINSISKQMVTFQVVQNGRLQSVNLLPKNFVFSEQLTEQIKNLELNKVIRTREVRTANSTTRVTGQPQATVIPAPKVAKTATSGSEVSTLKLGPGKKSRR